MREGVIWFKAYGALFGFTVGEEEVWLQFGLGGRGGNLAWRSCRGEDEDGYWYYYITGLEAPGSRITGS